MNGEVTVEREAIVLVRVFGNDGSQIDVNTVLDTGFNGYLTLHPALIEELALPTVEVIWAKLADGSRVSTPVHRGTVLWNNKRCRVPVQATTGAALLGMSLLYGSSVTIEVLDGGSVTIEPIE